VRDRAPSPIGRENGIPERCLMQSCLDLAKRIPALGCIRWHGLRRSRYESPKGKLDPQALWVPPDNKVGMMG
jgi:hypothetical protein